MMKLSAFGDEIGEDLDTQLTLMRSLGIVGLDLRTAFGKNVMNLTYGEVVKVRESVRAHGMYVEAIGSPVNKRLYEPGAHAEEMSKLERAIYMAKALNTRKIRIFSPEMQPHGDSSLWPVVRDWFEPQVAMAIEKDVVLMHENDWRFFGNWPDHMRLLMETFGGPNFKAIFDPGNSIENGFRTMRDWFPWLLPHLITVHMKDRKIGAEWFCFAGEGDGEVQELLEFLQDNDWDGTLTLEPHASPAYLDTNGSQGFTDATTALRLIMDRAQVRSAGLW